MNVDEREFGPHSNPWLRLNRSIHHDVLAGRACTLDGSKRVLGRPGGLEANEVSRQSKAPPLTCRTFLQRAGGLLEPYMELEVEGSARWCSRLE